jgi:hypothetical protein
MSGGVTLGVCSGANDCRSGWSVPGREGFMVGALRTKSPFRPEEIGDFLDAAYTLETDDAAWLADVMAKARSVWGQDGPAHGAIYDASDVTAFRALQVHFIEFSDEAIGSLMRGIGLFTPAMVSRTFRALLVGDTRRQAPELLPMAEELGALGTPNSLNINGLDPAGPGVFIGMWARAQTEPPPAEMAV